MTDNTQPEAGSTHIIRYALELGLLWVDGDGRDKVREALDALDTLEAQLASIGAGGVQALSAAPRTPTVEQVEDEVSMGHGAWDMVDPQELIGAVLRLSVAASPTPPAEQQATKETSGGFHVWRDISTAPKDGSRFVATGHNYGLYSEDRHTCVAQWFQGCWMEASDWNETSELKYLTHWMPLPSPPDDVAAPAEQQATTTKAALEDVYAELLEPDATTYGLGAVWNRHSMRDFADRTHALRMEQAAPKAAPVLPEGWTACTIEFGNDGPEEVAYGPQRMMNRLAKWLGKYFAQVIAEAAPKAAPGELSADSLRHQNKLLAETLGACILASGIVRKDIDGFTGPELLHFGEDLRSMLEAAPQQEAQEPTEIPEEIERMAADRYKVVPSHESMFHRWAVVAGTGTQQLYLGREVECQNMARKFAGAFLDGAFVAMQRTAPQPAPAPLSDDVVRDAARWRMVALIGNEVMLHPEKRTQAAAVKAYMDATHSGLDLTGAVDAALAAQGGK